MESRFRLLLSLSLAFSLAACGAPSESQDDGAAPTATPADPESANDVVLDDQTAEAITILEFLNDGSTTVELLDVHVGLDSRAAENLVAHRDGPDGVIGTADDDLFDSTEEVDAVAWVGPAAIATLTEYVTAQGWLTYSSGVWETVAFNTNQVTLTLDLVNFATLERLDDEVKLDSRAAENIVAARPIVSMNQLAAIEWVGPAALERLRAHLTTWQLEGITFEAVHDGVLFSFSEAAGALAAANTATEAELHAAGISGAQDNLLLNGRPWSSLSLVSSTAGIGPLTMMRLKILAPQYPSSLHYVSHADAIEFGAMAEGALRDDEGFGDELLGLLQDVTPEAEWREQVIADVLDAIMVKVHDYALTRIGHGYSSRDAAFNAVYQYGRGLFQAALTGYPDGILALLPPMSVSAKLARAKSGILAYFENVLILSDEWQYMNGQTWNDVKTQVGADVAGLETSEAYELHDNYPDAQSTTFVGRVYGLYTEATVDDVGKVTRVYIEID